MDLVQTRLQYPELANKRLCSDWCPSLGTKSEVFTIVKSTTNLELVNTAGTDENLFRLVPVRGHGAQVGARAPTKDYVQTGVRPWAPSLNVA